MPDAVHHYPSCQRIVWRSQPVSQHRAPSGRVNAHWRNDLRSNRIENGEESRLDFFPISVVDTYREDVGFRRLAAIVNHGLRHRLRRGFDAVESRKLVLQLGPSRFGLTLQSVCAFILVMLKLWLGLVVHLPLDGCP